jgi:hypothetical protein
MKFFLFLVKLIFWLWLFLIPVGIMGFIAYSKYYDNPKNISVPIIFLLIGVSLGIFIAEFVRRKFGLAYFFSRINASPDYDKFSTSVNEDKPLSTDEQEVKKKD